MPRSGEPAFGKRRGTEYDHQPGSLAGSLFPMPPRNEGTVQPGTFAPGDAWEDELRRLPRSAQGPGDHRRAVQYGEPKRRLLEMPRGAARAVCLRARGSA